MLVLIVLISIAACALVLWTLGLFYANDFSVPTCHDVPAGKRVLVIFPHADDEGLNAGGLLRTLSAHGCQVDWIILTRGEKGTPNGTMSEELKTIRPQEAATVAKILRINAPQQKDYPDGDVDRYMGELKADLAAELARFQPEIVLTYDLAGMYGHPDHIAVAEVVTELVRTQPNVRLWYVSYPRRQIDALTLPERMAKDVAFKASRVYPTHKMYVGLRGIRCKLRVLKAYRSQRQSYRDSFPLRFVPMWCYVILTPFEYYHEVPAEKAA